ncbi:MAG: hypothetical protein PHR51_00135 [Patescibacteria group bacterium]|nr:hypothetical protein [Patescibacteria group bacterium]
MADKKIGKVTHYYDKIGVAIVGLESDLALGDQITFKRGGEEVGGQVVDSMQIEKAAVDKAKKGDVIGLQVEDPIREGTEIYK